MLYHQKQPFYMLGNSCHISQCLLIMIHSSRLTVLYLIVNVGGSNPWCLSNISQYLQINGLVRIYIQQLINLNQHIGTGEILKKTFMNNALEIQMARIGCRFQGFTIQLSRFGVLTVVLFSFLTILAILRISSEVSMAILSLMLRVCKASAGSKSFPMQIIIWRGSTVINEYITKTKSKSHVNFISSKYFGYHEFLFPNNGNGFQNSWILIPKDGNIWKHFLKMRVYPKWINVWFSIGGLC